ncbi:MAG: competence/damage-inducible protein A [Gammaproteobacteria bacterium]|jgi:nicotinamide-nucleotide amidase|nr:competence/damage-inducible protein A [Gammaproteobacteria bacterium]MBT5223114.1 competence/damage-inducible protein A [Gammaproteobacteria bacterium]MBT5826225.1 competence/damage-inducible protein A [Gammaproteobacteria bacterium]MBT5965803.1 competence/damage-inducible protein A [Gammaproteobacteria bacterium]MBT6420572.1 competence/damage-inducible protein A [Gammaproteobacteria bacterium]
MQTIAEIFSQGEEIVSGQTVDTNAAWLSQKLVQMGFVVKRHSAVGDNLTDLKNLLQDISLRADLCICTGGLGPTIDDLTAQAVAESFSKPLQLDAVALEQITQYFSYRKREMVDSNRKQAFFPQGALRIDNEWGSAPGFSVQHNRCWFVFVPGVPYEMKHMFDAHIAKQLTQRFSVQPGQLITLRSVGIGEADLQEKLNTTALPDSVQLSFRAAVDEVQTKLIFLADAEQELVRKTVNQLAENIGDYIFAIDGLDRHQGDLVEVISKLMQQQKYNLSIQETASQGLMAAKCIAQSWLISSVYKQSLQQQTENQPIAEYKDIALGIAQNRQQQDGTDLVLVQLYAGNAEQFQQKELSIILFSLLLTPAGVVHSQRSIVGSKARKQNQAAIYSLDLLRRFLQNKTL